MKNPKKELTPEELQIKKIKKNKRRKLRWNIFRQINRLYWVGALVVVAFIAFMGSSVHSKYKNTLDWKKNTSSSVTMANQSLDLLYDKDPVSRENKASFDKLRAKMINSDGSLTKHATWANLKTLERTLSRINTKGSTRDYKKLYAEVALKFSLDEQYDSLFIDKGHNELKKTVSPATLAALNDSSFNDLNALFNANNDDKFVESYISRIKKLLSDVDTFNELVDLFNNSVVIENKTVTLKDGYHDSLDANFGAIHSKLNHKWSSTLYMENVVKMLKPVVAKTQEQYLVYGKYETDMKNREEAYTAWQATQEDFFNQVKAIHEAAIKEKRAKEEEDRRKKEVADAKDPAKKTIDTLVNLSAQEKDKFKSAIDAADTMDKIKAIITDAQKADLAKQEEKSRKEREANEAKTKETSSDKKEVN